MPSRHRRIVSPSANLRRTPTHQQRAVKHERRGPARDPAGDWLWGSVLAVAQDPDLRRQGDHNPYKTGHSDEGRSIDAWERQEIDSLLCECLLGMASGEEAPGPVFEVSSVAARFTPLFRSSAQLPCQAPD